MGLLDFFGSMFNTNSVNKQNMKINQMNNEFNAAEAEKARQFQLDMYNRVNEYNTASAQRQRLENAGLNPYLMMNGGSAGVAQSSGSSSPASAAPPLSMSRADFSGIDNTLATGIELALRGKETSANVNYLGALKSQAEAQANRTLQDIDWFKLEPTYKEWSRQTGLMRMQLGYDTDKQNLSNMRWTENLMRVQRSNLLQDEETKKILNKYFDQSEQTRINLMAAQYYSAMASGTLSYEKCKTELTQQILNDAKAKGIRISNHIAESVADGQIRALNAEYMASGDYYSMPIYEKTDKGYVKVAKSAYHYKTRMDMLNQRWNYGKRYWDEGLNAINTIGNAVGNIGSARKPGPRNTYVYGNRTYNNY